MIYAGNVIGRNFQTGNKVNIRESNRIGDNVSVGTLSVIEHHVEIGNNVRIHTQVFIPEFSVLEDGCWIGPNVVFTNAKYPLVARSQGSARRARHPQGSKDRRQRHPPSRRRDRRERARRRRRRRRARCPCRRRRRRQPGAGHPADFGACPTLRSTESTRLNWSPETRCPSSLCHSLVICSNRSQGQLTMQTLRLDHSIPFVDLKAQYQSIRTEIDAAIAAVIKDTAFIGGPFVKEFEEAFARYCGVDHCVGVANGTDAIFIALRALGIGPGDEVITVANSFVATSEAIKMAGAQVVFVDCNPRTYTIDVSQIEAKITPRTKAIIPVHSTASRPTWIRSLALAREARPARWSVTRRKHMARSTRDSRLPSWPTSPVSASIRARTSVRTATPARSSRTTRRGHASARMLANHGRTQEVRPRLRGREQPPRRSAGGDSEREAALTSRTGPSGGAEAAYRYNQALRWYRRSDARELDERPRRLSPLHRPSAERPARGAAGAPAGHGISTGIHYPIALPYLQAYAHLGHGKEDFPVSLQASGEILSLPLFPELTEEQIQLRRPADQGVRGIDRLRVARVDDT